MSADVFAGSGLPDGGFFAPPRPAAPPPPPLVPPAPASESGIGPREALVVTGLALLASLCLRLSTRHPQLDQYDHALRKGLVITLFFYLGLGAVLATYVLVRGVKLVWFRGSALHAVALGLPVGAVLGGAAVALNSAVNGRLSGDPNIEQLVGGGGALRICLTLAVTSVLAPLVEETLFRAICAGSLIRTRAAAAMWISALAFAVWHMNPTSLRYYAAMGLLLASLWRRRGLLASMAAHAAFNGALTLAAVAATSGAGHLTSYDGLVFELPGGFHHSALGDYYEGPAGTGLDVATQTGFAGTTTTQLLVELRRRESVVDGRAQVVAGSEREVVVDGREAVVADVVTLKQPGHVLQVVSGDRLYTVYVVTGGSPAGERAWSLLSRSLQIGS